MGMAKGAQIVERVQSEMKRLFSHERCPVAVCLADERPNAVRTRGASVASPRERARERERGSGTEGEMATNSSNSKTNHNHRTFAYAAAPAYAHAPCYISAPRYHHQSLEPENGIEAETETETETESESESDSTDSLSMSEVVTPIVVSDAADEWWTTSFDSVCLSSSTSTHRCVSSTDASP